jgi:hypothetical protein
MKRGSKFVFLLSILLSVLGCRGNKDTYPVLPQNARTNSIVHEARSFKIGAEKYEDSVNEEPIGDRVPSIRV